VLGSIHELAAETGALHRRMHRKQPEIAAIATGFYVDTARIIRDEELTTSEEFPYLIEIDSIAFNEEFLHAEGPIDYRDQSRSVARLSTTNVH
jgi:hypothetical protein